MPNKNLVLFDFDGTITTKDSMLIFVKFCVGSFKYYTLLISIGFVMILYKLGIKTQVKALFLSWAFKGISKEDLEKKGVAFCEQKLPSILNQQALDHIRFYKNQGDEICIVSASCLEWIKPWANQHELSLISTQLAYKNGLFNGNLDGKNCNGYQKVLAIKKTYSLEGFNQIIAYGNSKGDQKMLDLADQPYFIKNGQYPPVR